MLSVAALDSRSILVKYPFKERNLAKYLDPHLKLVAKGLILWPVINKFMVNPQDHLGQKASSSCQVKEAVLITVKIRTATMAEVSGSPIFLGRKNSLGNQIRFTLNNSQVEQKTVGRRKKQPTTN